MGSYPVGKSVMDGPYFEVERLYGAESTLDLTEGFVAPNRLIRAHLLTLEAGTDDIDSIEH